MSTYSGRRASSTGKSRPRDGRQRLIAAGLRLGARGTSLSALGLRELAREAGLNPNTFYRHFRDMDELGLAAVEEVTKQLRLGLHEIRRGAVKHADATQGSAEYFLEFARKNPEAFLVGVREIHGGSPKVRQALRKVMREIASEVAKDIRERGLAPTSDPDLLFDITSAITDLMFFRSVEYIERPAERRRILARSVRLARMLFLGSPSL